MNKPSQRQIIGVMGGSYNPVHVGHLIVASYLCQLGGLDQVWLSLSPANPLKAVDGLAPDAQRMEMLRIALSDEPNCHLQPCDLELSMPRPSYTVTFLDRLAEMYPDKSFRLIIGSDNWLSFDRWRDPEGILSRHGVIIYPRPGYPVDGSILDPRARLVEAPMVELSSTFIREGLSQHLDMNFFLPSGVYTYILNKGLYGTGIEH